MIQYKDVTLRNLEEQVLHNKEEIARHWNVDRVLADFGITVLGRVDTKEELPEDEGENWGYGYLVGTEAPYDVYVWTRPNLNVGEPNAYWLDIGKISIVGPVGPRGETGSQGERGFGITSIVQNPNYTLTITYGDDLQYTTGNIRGAVGATGPRGIQGEPGIGLRGPQGVPGPVSTLDIRGTLSNAGELPTASTAKPGQAYLVGEIDAYDFYVLVGTAPENYEWVDMGLAGGGTIITVGGSAVGSFDADTKRTISTTPNQVYCTGGSGNQITNGWTVNPQAGAFPRYSSDKNLRTSTPVENTDAANKEYVDTLHADTIHGLNPGGGVYSIIWDGTVGRYEPRSIAYYAGAVNNGNIAMYMNKSYTSSTEPTATLLVGNPANQYQAANKNYVDLQHKYTHQITLYKYVEEFILFNITNDVATPYTSLEEMPPFSAITQGYITRNNVNFQLPMRISKDANNNIKLDFTTGEDGINMEEVTPQDYSDYQFTDTVFTNN